MNYTFYNGFSQIGTIKKNPTIKQLEAEPMLFSAGVDFAYKNGGPLTKSILDKIPLKECSPFKHIVIDTRIHMLMRGMIPAIPGWHGDGFPREDKYSQPNLKAYDYRVKHFATVLSSTPNVSRTEFAIDPVTLEVWKKKVWQSVDVQMREMENLRTYMPREGAIISFNQRSLHRATPCIEPGWRMFFRLTFYHRPPENKIRRQTQVYTTESKGW